MSILLDTDTAVALLRDRPTSVRRRFQAAHASGQVLLLSSVSLFELWYGVGRSQDLLANTERLADFLRGPVEIASFGELDAARAGELRTTLAAAGTPIGPYDLLIAAQAARLGYTVVTANTREFSRVADLTVEDWMTE